MKPVNVTVTLKLQLTYAQFKALCADPVIAPCIDLAKFASGAVLTGGKTNGRV